MGADWSGINSRNSDASVCLPISISPKWRSRHLLFGRTRAYHNASIFTMEDIDNKENLSPVRRSPSKRVGASLSPAKPGKKPRSKSIGPGGLDGVAEQKTRASPNNNRRKVWLFPGDQSSRFHRRCTQFLTLRSLRSRRPSNRSSHPRKMKQSAEKRGASLLVWCISLRRLVQVLTDRSESSRILCPRGYFAHLGCDRIHARDYYIICFFRTHQARIICHYTISRLQFRSH